MIIDSIRYSKLLKHPLWFAKRKEILDKKGHCCQKCGCEQNLHVHHLYYERVMPWEYPDRAFMVLCSPCHKNIHELLKPEPKKKVKKKKKIGINDWSNVKNKPYKKRRNGKYKSF